MFERLLNILSNKEKINMASQERFGFEWDRYSDLDPNYEIQFKKWVYPLTQDDFKGRKILDAGCGMGRNSYWSLRWGASEVVGFDYDKRSTEAAQRTLKDFNNARVEFKSIYDIDWQDEFDIAFSIGVIHHLGDPKGAMKNLIRAVKPGGKISVWVYGYEGNEWIVRFVSPIRRNITSKLPVGVVHFLSYFLSVPLWFFVKIFKGPGPYLKQLSTFKLWHVQSIVFDHLIPKIANYWRREEARDLLAGFDEIEDIQIYHINNNSWAVLGKKK